MRFIQISSFLFFMNFCGEKITQKTSTNALVGENNKKKLYEEVSKELSEEMYIVDKASDLPSCSKDIEGRHYYTKENKTLKVCFYDEESASFRYDHLKGDKGSQGDSGPLGQKGAEGSLEKSINILPGPTFSTTSLGLNFVLTMDPIGTSQIFYTTDESTPTINSSIYGPSSITLECCDDVTYKALQTHWFFENSSIATYTVSFLYEFGFTFGFPGNEGEDGEFSSPKGIAVDSAGNIYVTDSSREDLQKFDPNGEYVATFGQFDYPMGIAIDQENNIYVADEYRKNVQKFDPNGDLVFSIELDQEDENYFDEPVAVAVDASGNIYVLDDVRYNVQKFDPNGDFVFAFGSYGEEDDGEFDSPRGIALDSNGNIYVVDAGREDVQKFNSSGLFVSKFGSYGEEDGEFDNPRAIAIDRGNNIYIVDSNRDNVQKFDSNGNFLYKFGSYGEGEGEFESPRAITVDANNNIFIVDSSREDGQKIVARED
jgi:DNA-binding beta-propeller fold protein YncE